MENLEKKPLYLDTERSPAKDFVLDLEYLIILLVIIPKSSYAQWQKTYESLLDMMVPPSTKLIAEDNEAGLFTD